MSESNIIFSTPRDWKEITNRKKVHFLLNEFLNYKNLIVNLFPIEIELKFHQLKCDNSYLFSYDKTIKFYDKTIEAYMSISRQLVFKFLILSQFLERKIIHCQLLSVLVSKKNRKHKRFYVNNQEIITEKFIFFKENNIEDNLKEILVNLQKEHSSQVRDRFPNSKVYHIDNSTLNLKFELDLLKKRQIPIYFNTDESQTLIQNTVCNLRDILKSNEELLIDKLYEYESRKIDNFLLYPIFSFFSGKKNIFFYAYAKNLSKAQYIDLIEIYRDLEKSLNQDIISNSIQVKLQQKIINISLGGFLLEVTDEVLIDYLLKISFFSSLFLLKNRFRIESISQVKHIKKMGNRYIMGFEFLYPCFKKSHFESLQKRV